MSNQGYHKACPNCRRQSPLAQDVCDGCGHVFRTRFTDDGRRESERTMVVTPSPAAVVAPPGEQVPIYCTRCRARIDASVIACPTCGWDQRQYAQVAPPPVVMAPAPPQMPPPPQMQASPYYPPPPQQPGYYSSPQQQMQAPPMASYQSDIIQYPPGLYNTTAAILLGFFITGAGQMANRQLAKGVVLLLAAVILGLPTYFLGSFVIWLLAFIDAIQIAGRLSRGEPVGQWQWF